MNALVRTLTREHIDLTLPFDLTKRGVLILLLFIGVLLSATAVVYVKDTNRQLVSQLQSLEFEQHRIEVERGKLLLEQSALATQARVQRIAQQGLQMILPPADIVVMVQP